ncbi:putative reverse transcriptase domain-containing protein [Tanacetum coccineum]
MKLSMKKLDDFGDKYQVYGRIVGIKSFLMLFGITTFLIDVNDAQSKLVLLENFNENYSKCLRLYKVNAAEGVNAASEEVSTAELGWLKLLQLQVLVRPFFWVKLGNGRDTSVWHDSWCSYCSLIRLISPRDIYSVGFNNQAMVANFVLNNAWTWPQAWIAKALILNLIPAPNLDEITVDCIRWRDIHGVFSEFSVSRAWEAFRPRGNEVNWFRIMWFPHSIPRHLFHLWLVMQNSLKTQDKLRQWDVGINTDLNLLRCSLCNTQSDSHAHLFFECPYSSKVWKLVRHLADMELVLPILYDIVDHIQPMASKRTARSIFGKLILAASSYFVWLERNNRLFKNVKRTPEELRDVIMVTVRLKLLLFKFKNSANVISLLDHWKMPRSFRLYVC